MASSKWQVLERDLMVDHQPEPRETPISISRDVAEEQTPSFWLRLFRYVGETRFHQWAMIILTGLLVYIGYQQIQPQIAKVVNHGWWGRSTVVEPGKPWEHNQDKNNVVLTPKPAPRH